MSLSTEARRRLRYGLASDAISDEVADAIDANTAGVATGVTAAAQRVGKSTSFLKTAAGNTTILAAAPVDRAVIITVTIDTTFAAGDGAAPIFDIGQTGSGEKFKANLNSGNAGTTLSYAGVLSADTALLVGATAATGSTSAGAITVTAIAVPLEA